MFRQSCISEAQKYQGALYRPEKEKKGKSNGSRALVPQKAYVEDGGDEEEYEYTGALTIVEPPPEAPSPPSAAPGFRTSPTDPVNVFDFYVGEETPNPSTLNLAATEQRRMVEDTPSGPSNGGRRGVWFEDDIIEDDEESGALVQYGSGPVPTAAYQTPAPKADRESRKVRDREPTKEEKKDKKRKRLHVDTSAERSRSREADEIMTDAPPVLHSGLTGGLNRLLSRPETFPPSPDYSGDAAGEPSPGSPLKRSKHSKRGRERNRDTGFSNGIMSLISTKKPKKTTDTDRVRKHKRRLRENGEDRPAQKMIEYEPMNGDTENSQQMVVYRENARADLFMSFVNKGPESEKGCSINKTLKRFHRERENMGFVHRKDREEKELWRSLRLKKNDRGEIVLFCAGT
jgi:cell growth-regulating nucleolar protein